MPDMTLAVGDRLVYPNQGLCSVTEIKTEEIAGQKLTFVSLTIIETGAKVKVPREKLEKNGVRRVSTSDDVKKVIEYLRSDSEKASLDWKKRARDNTARLSEGGLIGLAEVVKGLQVLSELRPLPPKERELYNDARHLFVEELAAAMGVSSADAEDAFDILLFVPGKDRPKRSIEEFQGMGGEDDELGLDGELIGLDGEAPADEAEGEGEKAEEGDSEEAAEEAEPQAEKKAKAAAAPKTPKAKKPPKEEAEAPKKKAPKMKAPAAKAAKPSKPPKATTAAPAPKKRGRPSKAK